MKKVLKMERMKENKNFNFEEKAVKATGRNKALKVCGDGTLKTDETRQKRDEESRGLSSKEGEVILSRMNPGGVPNTCKSNGLP